MEMLKAQFDRFLLAAAGLLLAAVSLFIAGEAGSLASRFPPIGVRTEGAAFESDPDIAQLAADQSQMEQRRAWKEAGNSLFVSRVYLLREGRLVDILESGTELFPGIANAWILEHNLDYTDPALPDTDPDEDGFSNLEEFMVKTDPRDAASKPALWTKLRTTGSRTEKLRFKFMSLPTGSLDAVSINTVSAENPQERSGSTQFYPRASEEVRTEEGADGIEKVDKKIILLAGLSPAGTQIFEITPFKFVRAEKRKEMNPATNVEEEIPFAVLVNTADGKEIILPLAREGDGPIDSPYAVATIQDTRRNGQTYELSSGKTFELDSETYKLVDVKEGKAIIENLQSGEQHEVPLQAAASVPNSPEQRSP
jgi:hypothetical protein